MSWVPDETRSISITLLGEGYASLAWVAAPPPTAEQGQLITLRVDVTNTGSFSDSFRVSFDINGVITNYDAGTIDPQDVNTVTHSFIMPNSNVSGSVTGEHEEGGMSLRAKTPRAVLNGSKAWLAVKVAAVVTPIVLIVKRV